MRGDPLAKSIHLFTVVTILYLKLLECIPEWAADAGAKRRPWLKNCAWWLSAAVLFVAAVAQAQIDDRTKQLAHDIFKQLIEINTTDSVGSVTAASEAMAQRFPDAGFPENDLRILGPNDRKKKPVVRLRGSAKHEPVLLIGNF